MFCGRVPWLYQYWPDGFILFVVLCPGTHEGSTGSGSGFKASQMTGQQLKVSSGRLGEASQGIEPATPGLQDIGLSPTPRGELGIDDTFKKIRFSMHILTIKYLRIYKYYDVILFSEKEKSTSILLKFLLFIICEYNLILYKYISFHDSMKNK